MITEQTTIHPHDCKCLSWKPIIAGALTAIGLSFLLNLFSVAIGLTAYTTNSQGVENLAFAGLIATALGIVASMFASGWIAGYLGHRHCNKRHLGALYGFFAWCIALIVMVFLAEPIHTYIITYTHILSGTPIGNPAAANAMPLSPAPTTNSVVISAYIVFVLFFLSAFASSFGGHCGMRYINKDERISR